jgi:hypothetical protein
MEAAILGLEENKGLSGDDETVNPLDSCKPRIAGPTPGGPGSLQQRTQYAASGRAGAGWVRLYAVLQPGALLSDSFVKEARRTTWLSGKCLTWFLRSAFTLLIAACDSPTSNGGAGQASVPGRENKPAAGKKLRLAFMTNSAISPSN